MVRKPKAYDTSRVVGHTFKPRCRHVVSKTTRHIRLDAEAFSFREGSGVVGSTPCRFARHLSKRPAASVGKPVPRPGSNTDRLVSTIAQLGDAGKLLREPTVCNTSSGSQEICRYQGVRSDVDCTSVAITSVVSFVGHIALRHSAVDAPASQLVHSIHDLFCREDRCEANSSLDCSRLEIIHQIFEYFGISEETSELFVRSTKPDTAQGYDRNFRSQ